MRFALLLLAAVAALATTADAAPPPNGAPPPGDQREGPGQGEGGRGGPHLFLSPDGEPFRGGDGRAAWFAGADANHDGALSLDEFRADAMRFFKALDVNHDGVIDGHENQTYERQVAPEITRLGLGPPGGGMRGHRPQGGFGDKRAGGERIGLEGAARYSMLNEPQPVRGADLDLDYRVTAEEWAKTAAKRFNILDKDGDGRLTLQTLPQTPGSGPDHGGPHKRRASGRVGADAAKPLVHL